MQIGSKYFDIGKRTYIVGILNVTPDSFFDGDSYTCVDSAVAKAKAMVADGADIIEIGGESTRPGHVKVDANEEISRVLPTLQQLVSQLDVPISVDTSKSKVARAALLAGAAMINDIWGFKHDPDLAATCAEFSAVCCTMHNRSNTTYTNFLPDVLSDINDSVDILTKAGVNIGKIIIDPGVGFAKSVEQNIEVLRNLDAFVNTGYPVMLGASRKSFIEKTIGLALPDRLEATVATTVLATQAKCAFVRVHDVLENKRAAMMADYITRGQK